MPGPPDGFPQPYAGVTGGSHRPTSATVGGGPNPRRRGAQRGGAALIGGARQSPDVDEPASAALERWWDERYRKAVKLRGGGVMPASGFLWVALATPGPSDGFVWNLRRINVGPVDYTALPFATGVTVVVTVGGQTPPRAGQITADQVITVQTTWPAEYRAGAGEVTVEGGEYLWVGIAGFTSGATVTVGGQADETAARVPEVYGI